VPLVRVIGRDAKREAASQRALTGAAIKACEPVDFFVPTLNTARLGERSQPTEKAADCR